VQSSNLVPRANESGLLLVEEVSCLKAQGFGKVCCHISVRSYNPNQISSSNISQKSGSQAAKKVEAKAKSRRDNRVNQGILGPASSEGY
jgi:hypothetical protein